MFSIIVPTYNHAKYLPAALDSILAQSLPDWEAVVVNDGSTDDTPNILNLYSGRDKRIRIFNKPNGGTASAINLALSQVKGEWICWLSSDDFYESNKLQVHKSYITQYPQCEFFFSHFHMKDEYTGVTIDRDLFGPLPDRELQIPVMFYRNYVMGVGICIKHDLWERVGILNESLSHSQDYDMWLRLLQVSPGIFVPERTFTYRHHSEQGSETFQLACLFDASKASIEFINRLRFEEYFPLLDLSNSDSAVKAFKKVLEVSADPTSYVYSLGFHPALILRVIEWLNATKGPYTDRLKQSFQDFSQKISKQYSGTYFGAIWEAGMHIVESNSPVTYKPISPIAVALNHYYNCRNVNSPVAEPLGNYLEKCRGINLAKVHFEPHSLEPDNDLLFQLCEEQMEYSEQLVLLADMPKISDETKQTSLKGVIKKYLSRWRAI